MGFIIEKAFQNGRKVLEEQGVRVESLASGAIWEKNEKQRAIFQP